MDLANTVRVARCNEPAELVLRNAKLINVFTAEIYTTDIIINDTRVVALGKGYDALDEIDLQALLVVAGCHGHGLSLGAGDLFGEAALRRFEFEIGQVQLARPGSRPRMPLGICSTWRCSRTGSTVGNVSA